MTQAAHNNFMTWFSQTVRPQEQQAWEALAQKMKPKNIFTQGIEWLTGLVSDKDGIKWGGVLGGVGGAVAGLMGSNMFGGPGWLKFLLIPMAVIGGGMLGGSIQNAFAGPANPAPSPNVKQPANPARTLGQQRRQTMNNTPATL